MYESFNQSLEHKLRHT